MDKDTFIAIRALHHAAAFDFKFVDHGGHTAVLVKINITESHFDNTLRLETHFRTLAEKYNSWNGTGVFNKTFKGYSKNY